MWVQYGEQGKGYCFAMKSSFFDIDYDETEHDIIYENNGREKTKKYIPYRVVYINNKCENGLDIHFGDMSNTDDKKKASQIKKEIKKISKYINNISKLCDNDEEIKDKVLILLKEGIEQIRYLFKSVK